MRQGVRQHEKQIYTLVHGEALLHHRGLPKSVLAGRQAIIGFLNHQALGSAPGCARLTWLLLSCRCLMPLIVLLLMCRRPISTVYLWLLQPIGPRTYTVPGVFHAECEVVWHTREGKLLLVCEKSRQQPPGLSELHRLALHIDLGTFVGCAIIYCPAHTLAVKLWAGLQMSMLRQETASKGPHDLPSLTCSCHAHQHLVVLTGSQKNHITQASMHKLTWIGTGLPVMQQLLADRRC